MHNHRYDELRHFGHSGRIGGKRRGGPSPDPFEKLAPLELERFSITDEPTEYGVKCKEKYLVVLKGTDHVTVLPNKACPCGEQARECTCTWYCFDTACAMVVCRLLEQS